MPTAPSCGDPSLAFNSRHVGLVDPTLTCSKWRWNRFRETP